MSPLATNVDWREYAQATPFPHAVVDDFIDPRVATAIAAEFPPADDERWTLHDDAHERKWQGDDESMFGVITRTLLDILCSDDYAGVELCGLTGIAGLKAHVSGGGYHRVDPGGFLGMHTDSLHDPEATEFPHTWYRCLNLLVFLTDNSGDGTASLHLESETRGGWDNAHVDGKMIVPKPGRAVIFTTDGNSYHGHPTPLAGPGDRRSLAVYYYRETPPSEYTGDQPTTFVTEAL